MVSINGVKISLLRVEGETAFLSVEDGEARKEYRAQIIDRDGLFAVEYPSSLGLMLNRYPAESKELIGELRAMREKIAA